MGNSNIKKYEIIDNNQDFYDNIYARQFLELNYTDMTKLFTTKAETIKWLKQFGDCPSINRIINSINDTSYVITKREFYVDKKNQILIFKFKFYCKITRTGAVESFRLNIKGMMN